MSMFDRYRGKAKPLKGGSSKDLGFLGLDGPLGTTERKIKSDRAAVVRFDHRGKRRGVVLIGIVHLRLGAQVRRKRPQRPSSARIVLIHA